MTDGQSELAEQIDADVDLGSASRVRGRCDLLAKMIEEHTPATIVLNQFRLLTNSVIRAVQVEIMAREVKHHGGFDDFHEEDFVWCPHCLTDVDDCKCPTRDTPLSWPSKEDVKTVLDYVHTQSDCGNSWLASTIAA